MTSLSSSSSSLTVADHWSDLVALFEPRCNVVQLRRALPSPVRAVIEQLSARHWTELRATLHADHDQLEVSPLQGALAEIVAEGSGALVEDLAELAQVLRDLTGAEAVGVRLSRLERPACPRYHFDRVGLRVVTTYLGEGTEFVPDHWVPGSERVSTNLGQREDLDLVADSARQAETGDVLFLKGTVWPGNGPFGAVHRSPVTTAGRLRIMATLDPL